MRSIPIAIVEPDELNQYGIQNMLEDSPRWHVANVSARVHSFFASLKSIPVEIVLINDALPPATDVWSILADCYENLPRLQIVILSQQLSTHYIQRLFRQGVMGFIHRPDCTRSTLLACLDIIGRNKQYVSPAASAELYRRSMDAHTLGLRKVDLDVLKCMHEGLNTQEIALRLGLGERTIYRSRSRLRNVLNVRTNEQLIAAAIRRGLIDPNA
jgi:DNA-binding NarL/FixJ family response regulator